MARLIKVGEYENDHEIWAARYLKEKLSDDFLILTNVDVYTENGSRLECDQIIIGVHAVYVVEVKGYRGRVHAGKDYWTFDTGHEPYRSFVKKTRDKAIVLRERMKRRITARGHYPPWVQHVVFVTGVRGRDLELTLENSDEPICDPGNIVERLTKPELLTGERYHGPLTDDQLALAEREIAALEELRRIPVRWGSFKNIVRQSSDGPYLVSRGTLRVGDFSQDFLLRVLEKTAGADRQEYYGYLNALIEEASIYRELSGVPGVPYVVPPEEDDERVVFAISFPRGRQLSKLKVAEMDLERRLGILRSVASTVKGVHARGMVHGRLDPEWIFATEGGEIQILNFTASIGGESPFPAPELSRASLMPASDVYSMAHVFAPWFGRFAGDSGFQLDSHLGNGLEPLSDWFASAVAEDPADRPEIGELVQLLRRIELGISVPTAAVEGPFERAAGSILHDTYRLEVSLGEGPAGEVWQAKHQRGNYPLALYFADQGDEASLRSRFEEVASLHHPMIVRTYDMRREPGRESLYMAADWFDGEPLDQLIESGELPDQSTIMSWMRDLLIALEFAHEQGVLHRNISPDAVVIVQDRPRLVEFSLLLEAERRAGLIEYTDPQVAKTGWRRESDLYALAATFLSLLAGITPRTRQGRTLEMAQIERAFPASIPEATRRGLINALSADFELESVRYVELFGVQEPPRKLEKLPDEFLKQWGLSLTGHQERVARYLIQEFFGNKATRARQRTAVVAGSLALTDVRANKALREAANAAISALKSAGVLYSPAGTKAVRPTEEFLSAWNQYASTHKMP